MKNKGQVSDARGVAVLVFLAWTPGPHPVLPSYMHSNMLHANDVLVATGALACAGVAMPGHAGAGVREKSLANA